MLTNKLVTPSCRTRTKNGKAVLVTHTTCQVPCSNRPSFGEAGLSHVVAGRARGSPHQIMSPEA